MMTTLPRFIRVLLSVFAAFAAVICFTPFSLSQQQMKPPKQMQICTENGCDMLAWAGDHYDSRFLNRYHNSPEITQHWSVKSWRRDNVELVGVYIKPTADGQTKDSDVTGKMSSQEGLIRDANFVWTANGKNGARTATITWSEHPTINEAGSMYYPDPRHSLLHASILLPPYAAEEFAGFPNDVRAILQPTSAITHEQAQLPCSSSAALDDGTMLEIGKFALRANELDRGHCWVKRSAATGNRAAETILGVTELMGWGGPQDLNSAFRHFEPSNTDHYAWGLHFLETCYAQGLGVAQNGMTAGIIDMNMTKRPGGNEVTYSIGADDGAVVSSYNKGVALLNPPMKSHEVCDYTLRNQAPCHTVTEVDQQRLQQKLDSIK